MTCEQARRLVHHRLDGGPAPGDQDQLKRHLAACAACAQVADGLRDLDKTLRHVLGAAELRPGFLAALQAALPIGEPRRPALAWRWGWAAAMALIVAVGCLVALRRNQPSPPVTVRASEEPLHVFTSGSDVSRRVEAGGSLSDRDTIWGIDGSGVCLEFRDGARLELSGDAVVQIGQRAASIFKGSARADLSRARERFALSTRWGVIEGSGAVFSLTVVSGGDEARLSVVRGSVRVVHNGGQSIVSAGESILIHRTSGGPLSL